MFACTAISLLIAGGLWYAFFYFDYGHAMLWAFLLVMVFLLSFLMATWVTRNITQSISQIDFDSPDDIKAYDEFTKFIRTILQQRVQIGNQMHDIEERIGTIRAIIDNMQEGLVMLDQYGSIITANPSAIHLFGIDSDYEGKNAIFLTRNIVFLDKAKAALLGHGSQMVLDMEKTYQVSFIPSADKGALILIADITEKQLAERMRREFSANVSHELNTPLTAIAGFAEIICAGMAAPEDIAHFAGRINVEAKRMVEMIDGIMFLSRLDESDGAKEFVELDVAEAAAEAIESLSHLAEKKQIELSMATSPCIIKGNRLLIYEMFVNLIDNAIQYNKQGGWIKVAVSLRNQTAYISVNDSGAGIPKEEQQRVFERFYRVDQSRGRKTGGAGLGLSIVKHIVRYHNGSIELESVINEGTRVYVKLPI